jgi:hypothetical protein
MLASRFVIFPGYVVMGAMASVILLFAVSLIPDGGRKQWRFSLGHLLFFFTLIAVMLGISVAIWQRL